MSRQNSAKKTATRPGRNGGALRTGNPGNSGGKAGRSGRRSDAFKELCRELATGPKTISSVRKILTNAKHPLFMAALRWASENGYGKPDQQVKVEHGVSESLAEGLKAARLRVARERAALLETTDPTTRNS